MEDTPAEQGQHDEHEPAWFTPPDTPDWESAYSSFIREFNELLDKYNP